MTDIRPIVVGVDNSPSMKKIFEKSTEHLDIDLTVLMSAKEALAYLQSNTANLIILSIILPDKNGFTLLKELRELPNHLNTPAIFVSSKDYTQDRIMAKKLGALEFVPKPTPIKTMTELIMRYTLDNRKQPK